MEEANERLLKRGIEIKEFTPELEEMALQLNREERYKVRETLIVGFQAPFLHILAGILIIIFWKAFMFDLLMAFTFGYVWASVSFIIITHVLLTTKLTVYDNVADVHATERGMMWVALDVTRENPYVVGTVGVKPLSPTVTRLVRLMVRSSYQGTGIGRVLLDTALRFATNEGFEAVEAETWDGAAKFNLFPMYSRRGFHRHHTSWSPSVWLPMYTSEFLMKNLK